MRVLAKISTRATFRTARGLHDVEDEKIVQKLVILHVEVMSG